MLRFPLGERTKAETRELARKFGLAIADKHDSQDICFVPSGHYADIIERLKPGAAEAGDIVDLDGKVLGAHSGIIHFTVGQRRGLGVATSAPLYVVRLDAERAPRRGRPARGVAHEPHRAARRQLDRRRRHRRGARRRPARGVREGALDPAAAGGMAAAGQGGYEVELVDGEDGVSPGQACVFYDAGAGQARVLGGGFIKSAVAAVDATRAAADQWRRRRPRAVKFETWGPRSTSKRRARLCALGAGLRSGVRRGVRRAAGAPRSPRPNGSAGASSKSASAPAFRCRITRTNRLVGVDLSEPMLRKAQGARRRAGARQCRSALAVMDAARLALPDNSFDVVVAQYVITAVPDPEATLDEFARVVKPGGEIVLVNHIGAESRPAPAVREAVSRRWRAGSAGGRNFRFDRLTDWAARHGGVRVIERRPMPPLGHFSLIRFERLPMASAAARPEPGAPDTVELRASMARTAISPVPRAPKPACARRQNAPPDEQRRFGATHSAPCAARPRRAPRRCRRKTRSCSRCRTPARPNGIARMSPGSSSSFCWCRTIPPTVFSMSAFRSCSIPITSPPARAMRARSAA